MNPPKLSAPVGTKPRPSKGPETKNKPADVELLRKLLQSNGYNKVPEGKKVDTLLLKVISAHQKKLGHKSPDGVVDPGGKTFKSLVPKYLAALKKSPPPSKEPIRVYPIIYRGKKYELLEKDYDAAIAQLLKTLKPVVYGRLDYCLSLAKIYHKARERADVKKDFWRAVSHDWIGAEDALPKAKTYDAAMKANNTLLASYRSKNLKKLDQAFVDSDKTIALFEKEVAHYLEKLGSGAKLGLTVIQVSRAVSFAILAAAAAPVLVAGSSMTLAQATAVSQVGARVIQSAGEELEKHASGQKVSVSSAIKNISIDGIIETITLGLISKVDTSVINKYVSKVLPKVASSVKGISSKHLHPMIQKFVSNTGEAMAQEVLKQGLTLTGEAAKKGKVPSKKDYEKTMTDLLYTGLSTSFLKHMTDFEASYKADYGKTVQSAVIPEVVKRQVAPGYKIPKPIEKKIVNQVYQKVADTALKMGYDQVVEVYTGKEDGKKLNKLMQQRLSRDKLFADLVRKELLKAAKSHKVPMKK